MKEIKLNDKVVKTIQVNKNKKVVTVVSDDLRARARNGLARLINVIRMEEGKEPLDNQIDEKVVTQSQPNNADEFDPYVGVALALAYNLFGSKTQFRKYVKEEILKETKEDKDKALEANAIKAMEYAKRRSEYQALTVQQLRVEAKQRGIKNYTKINKKDLINLLLEQ